MVIHQHIAVYKDSIAVMIVLNDLKELTNEVISKDT